MNIEVKSSDEMIILGQKVGRLLRGGDVIELVGDMGAGKTTLVKGIASGLDIGEPIQSPTFTVSRVYDGRDDIRLSHYDFYRLAEAGIMSDEIDEMAHDGQTITVIEWGEAVSDVLPIDRLTIRIIADGENTRNVEFRTGGDRSGELADKIT